MLMLTQTSAFVLRLPLVLDHPHSFFLRFRRPFASQLPSYLCSLCHDAKSIVGVGSTVFDSTGFLRDIGNAT
jgi:hypothetical protein